LRMGAGGSDGGAVGLNMSGDSTITAISNEGLIRVGSGYTGLLNMSDTAEITALAMTIDASNGSSVDLSDDAVIYLAGDQMAMVLEEISAGGFTSEGGTVNWVGHSLVSHPVYGIEATKITSIPEPATFGLLALMGGGMLWIRKRFHI